MHCGWRVNTLACIRWRFGCLYPSPLGPQKQLQRDTKRRASIAGALEGVGVIQLAIWAAAPKLGQQTKDIVLAARYDWKYFSDGGKHKAVGESDLLDF